MSLSLSVLRVDRLHPIFSGNKWIKLRPNLEEAARRGLGTILTWGGPWSNHILATTAACRIFGFQSIGIVLPGKNTSAMLKMEQYG